MTLQDKIAHSIGDSDLFAVLLAYGENSFIITEGQRQAIFL